MIPKNHQDIGQMQMYVKYTLTENNESIFASKYRLHLTTEKELIEAVEEEKKNLELQI